MLISLAIVLIGFIFALVNKRISSTSIRWVGDFASLNMHVFILPLSSPAWSSYERFSSIIMNSKGDRGPPALNMALLQLE